MEDADTDDLVLITMRHVRAVYFNGTWVRTVFQRYVCLTDALSALFDWLPSMAHHVLSGLMRDHADVCESMLLFQVGQHGTPFVVGDVDLLTAIFEMLCEYGFRASGYDELVVAMDPVSCFFFLICVLFFCGSRVAFLLTSLSILCFYIQKKQRVCLQDFALVPRIKL